MSINVNSTATSYNFILRNYYSKNRDAAKTVTRGNIKKDELVTADSDALSKISKTLRDLEYSSDNGVGIYNNVKAFTDVYNNLISSTSNSVSYDITHADKLLKKLVKSKKDELEDIGISVSASGKLKLNKETLLQSSPKKLSNIFSSDSDFTKKVKYYSGKIYKASNNINFSSAGTVFTPTSTPDNTTDNTTGIDTSETKNTFNALV